MRHHPRFAVCLFAVVALLFAFSGVAMSQEITGSIVGSVKDANGAAVKGATVTVTNLATNISRTVTSDGEGNYVVTPLEPGMTFTDEPSIIVPGRFGVRIEDVVVCEEGGGRKLGSYPATLVAN